MLCEEDDDWGYEIKGVNLRKKSFALIYQSAYTSQHISAALVFGIEQWSAERVRQLSY